MGRKSKFCTALLIGGAAVAASYDALAQSISVEEIVVTARKREESLQDIPLSVTAFTADQIERAGFQTLEDISLSTPGMQFNTDQAGSRPGRLFANIRIRGIEGSEFSTLQTASLFVDGIFALQSAQSLSFLDLERVEVIKGPQSAQFARNSFAGAINYITSDPSLEEWSGKITAEGATYDNYEMQASVEGPIVENRLAARLGVRLWQKGSQFTATDGGELGKQTTQAISGTLLAQPTDDWSIRFRAFYQEDEDGAEANAFLQGRFNDTCTGTSVEGFDSDGNSVTRFPTNFYCGVLPNPGSPGAATVDSNTSLFPAILAQAGQPNFLVDNLFNFDQFNENGLGKSFPALDKFGIARQILRLSVVSEYEFDNGVLVTATGSYNDNDAGNFRDWDLHPTESWWVTNPQAGDDLSFDIRAQSSGDERLRWLAGANYYEQEFLTSSNGGVFVHACANFLASLAGIGERCDTPGFFPVAVDGGDFVEAWGVYGSLSYDITDAITLDLEARYQEDERGDGIGTFTNSENQFLPRVSLSFKPTDDVNLYGTWSIGRLPGVVNANIIACSEQEFTTPYVDPNTGQLSTASECDQFRARLGDAFGPTTPGQRLDSYEIGMKSTWMDNRLRLNVAGYYYEWKNQPFNAFVTVFRDDNGDGVPNTNPNFFPTADAGSSKSYGAELESALAITEKWDAAFNLTYNKNKFTEFSDGTASNVATLGGIGGVESVQLRGNRSTRFPKWSWNLTSTYTDTLNDSWDWYVRGDLNYNGQAFAGLTNLSIIDSWALVNARLGVEKENLRVEFFVTNLFDEDNWRGGAEFTDFTIQDPGPGVIFDFTKLGVILLPQDKRTFGLRTSVKF